MAKDVIIILSDEKLIEKIKKRSLEIISDHQILQSFEKVQKVYEKGSQEIREALSELNGLMDDGTEPVWRAASDPQVTATK